MAKTWRYRELREAIANLAAPATEQSAYVTRMFQHMDGENARYRPTNELFEEFYDLWCCQDAMISDGELSEAQSDAMLPIHDYVLPHGFEEAFWDRPALFIDHRWDELRLIAAKALESFPQPD